MLTNLDPVKQILITFTSPPVLCGAYSFTLSQNPLPAAVSISASGLVSTNLQLPYEFKIYTI